MNLVAYDNVNYFKPKKDYIQVSYKRLLSSTIEYHDRYCILKRYDFENNTFKIISLNLFGLQIYRNH